MAMRVGVLCRALGRCTGYFGELQFDHWGSSKESVVLLAASIEHQILRDSPPLLRPTDWLAQWSRHCLRKMPAKSMLMSSTKRI